jgi:hypothetical protein
VERYLSTTCVVEGGELGFDESLCGFDLLVLRHHNRLILRKTNVHETNATKRKINHPETFASTIHSVSPITAPVGHCQYSGNHSGPIPRVQKNASGPHFVEDLVVLATVV